MGLSSPLRVPETASHFPHHRIVTSAQSRCTRYVLSLSVRTANGCNKLLWAKCWGEPPDALKFLFGRMRLDVCDIIHMRTAAGPKAAPRVLLFVTHCLMATLPPLRTE